MNKLISYMKYRKGNPFLRDIQIGDVTSWVWEDEHGTVLHKEPVSIILAEFPGAYETLGSRGLRKSDLPDLEQYLLEEHSLNVVDDLLMQAKEAIYEENMLMAVLLMAVAVEVKVKTSFLGGNSAASNAFDHSQEKGKISVSPLEFIRQIAKLTFDEGFNEFDAAAYDGIDQLFQCRNKVAHRGVGKYRNKKGETKFVDLAVLKIWWDAVQILFTWLEGKASALQAK